MLINLRGKSLIINQVVITTLFFMLAGIGFSVLNTMKQSADQMGQGKDVVADILPPPLYLIEANLTLYDLLLADASAHQPLIDKLNSLKKDFDTRNQYWDLSNLDEDVKASLMGEQRKQADLFWKEVQEKFLPAIKDKNTTQAQQSAQILRGHYDAHRKGVDTTVIRSGKYAEEKLNALSGSAQKGYWQLGIGALVGVLLVLVLAVPTINRIYRSLNEAGEAAAAIADGDLTRPMSAAGNDEVGELLMKLTAMRWNLLQIVEQVMTSSSQLASSAKVVAEITNQTTNGVKQQQNEIDQVATAMNEMTATVQEVARNAERAAAGAQSADQSAKSGVLLASEAMTGIDALVNAVEKSATVIHELEAESDNIGAVLDVIKSIAEQTNLLALNAAIEAARAGEQGRGFAVVADEVRTLASRTQKSTQEIHTMIERLQSGASNAVRAMEQARAQGKKGVEQVERTARSLTEITEGVATIKEMNLQIASAAEEQRTVAEAINRNVVNISQSSIESAHGSVQTANASQDLAHLATALQTVVSRFKV